MIKKKENPPRLARWILSLQDHYERNYFITGDCSEEYKQIVQQKGKPSALFWIWGQVFSVMALKLKTLSTFWRNHVYQLSQDNFKKYQKTQDFFLYQYRRIRDRVGNLPIHPALGTG